MEEQLCGYLFVGLQERLRDLIRPHDLRDLLIAMEKAHDLEQARLHPRGSSGGTT